MPRPAALPPLETPGGAPAPLWPTPGAHKTPRRGKADGADGTGSLVMTPHRANGRGGRLRPSAFEAENDPLDAALVQLNSRRKVRRRASVRPHRTLVKMQLDAREGVGRG